MHSPLPTFGNADDVVKFLLWCLAIHRTEQERKRKMCTSRLRQGVIGVRFDPSSHSPKEFVLSLNSTSVSLVSNV
jgi:hypothetical protein